MVDIELLWKNETESETNTHNKNIHSGYKEEIKQRKMDHANNERRKKTKNGRYRTAQKQKLGRLEKRKLTSN